jgi:Putative zinc-finger
MMCRRAYEVDLAAFLRDPRAPVLAEFVEHYPRCPECAAEVRAWTEVHLTLDAQHPASAELLAYEDGTLDGGARAQVERHLATCAGCTEELRALRRFDAARVSPSVPDSASRRATTLSGGRARRLGRILWHPAVAYAIALLLLVPVLVQRPWETTPPAHQRAGAGEAEHRATGSFSRRVEADRLVVPPAPPAEPERPAAQAPHLETYSAQDLARGRPAPAPAAGAAAPQAGRKQAAAPGPTLDEDRRTLAIPLVPPLGSRDTLEVRVRDAGGTRELRQRVVPSDGADRLVLELPREWLTAGAWTVEVHAPDGVRRFALDVR